MTPEQLKKISKKLSFVLRHQPESIGIQLDGQGWADVPQLLKAFSKRYGLLTMEALKTVVENNDKKRFAFNADFTKIRASQGHSIEVDLDYEAQTPPPLLFHGTATRFLDAIREQGLLKMQRHHVHLSADVQTAQKVGSRHGKVVVLEIKSLEMHQQGVSFYLSANGVWLCESVPVDFIIFPES